MILSFMQIGHEKENIRTCDIRFLANIFLSGNLCTKYQLCKFSPTVTIGKYNIYHGIPNDGQW